MKYKLSALWVAILLLATSFSISQAQSSCSQTGTGQQMDLSVPNLTNQPLTVYWKDFQCAEQQIEIVAPGSVFYQQTYDGHEWVVRDASGQVVRSFTAQISQPTVVIGTVPFNPQPITSNCSSAGTNTTSDLIVINNTNDPALLYWIDFSCNEVFWVVIKGQDQFLQSTFVGHDWVVRYMDGTVVEQVTATGTDTVIINPPPTSQNNPTPQPNTQNNPTAVPQTNTQNNPVSGRDVMLLERWLNNQYELVRINPDGTGAIQLNQIGTLGRFSPDGTLIVFMSERDGDDEIYRVNVDGSNLQQLTNNTVGDVQPSFSPDGTRIIFASDRDGNYEIYTMNTDGSNVQRITNSADDDRGPRFSPDGTKILFHRGSSGNNDIYVMNMDGSGMKALTAASGNNAYPRFSPDGSQIVFHSNRDGNYEIYRMNADGSNPQRLTNDSLDDAHAFFSPDGSKIVFNKYYADDTTSVFVMNADGSNLQQLLADDFATDWFGSASAQSQPSQANNTNPAAVTTSSQFSGPAVQFIWNTDSFYIYNPGDTLKIVSIRFEELDSNGQSTGVFFEGSRWANIYGNLQRNFCNEIEISGRSAYLNPGICQGVNARIGPSASDPVIFWNNAGIRVLWGGTEIGRCPVSAGSCTLNLP